MQKEEIILSPEKDKLEHASQSSKVEDKSSSSKNKKKNTDSCKTKKQIDWSSSEYFPLLVQTINEKRRLRKLFKNPPLEGNFVPCTTMYNVLCCLGDRDPALANCFPQKQTLLLFTDNILVLQNIIWKRDQNNTGVRRKEAIQIIIDLGQAKRYTSTENHLDYLLHNTKLVHLKQGGRIVSTQSTTSERCQINTAQQMR